MGSLREAEHGPQVSYGPTATSGVHHSPTQPAPYGEDELAGSFIGGVMAEAVGAHFQPVVALRTGKTFGFEAIPHGSMEEPIALEELFARAAFEKKVGELGRAVRMAALAQCPSVPVFISVHPHELKESWLIRPDDPLSSHDSDVFLQISQSAFSPMCTHVLSEVSSRSGIALVLDDFGGSTSNLRQVIELSPAFVRLAVELVQGIDQSPRKRIVATAVVQMCLDLGAQVIAKGVETELEARVLEECGVAYGSGPILGVPTAKPSVSRWKVGRY